MREELASILSYFEKLDELDTTNVEPMMHVLPLRNVYRRDEVGPPLAREAALQNAPQTDGEYFLVPRIIETD
jgi:aspartyl-tRNA(Asn)/glutamyl-tRNA(Gln) amidotransferase subunit C